MFSLDQGYKSNFDRSDNIVKKLGFLFPSLNSLPPLIFMLPCNNTFLLGDILP